ncbi:hypothetical protein [Arenimonas composti]|uniref:Phospholipase/carboxylesterase/thioesterase domain-containing protein n=1 Tax=Arenimonas composti TR7-09 = DSM 18010 TaxID=1121013 RepID=A0A091BFS0_9GAMM|nr:hypothetical protein [Arenimonas composti]KFN50382.1 hypothetical protein P873_06830 [Arenimonas composti TR7-09 = DSM 18010]
MSPLAAALMLLTVSAATTVARLPVDAPSPLLDGDEYNRRLQSPIAADDLRRFVEASGRRLAAEEFAGGEVDAWIPPAEPDAGFGLLLFVLPDDSVALPPEWKRPLAERGILLLVVRGAGNHVELFPRRIPRILDAYSYAKARWRIDPARTWIGGFSGGARVAQRVAMAWPDEFTGTLQFAGSVIVGSARLAPPPPELARQLQQRTRFVFVSGQQDPRNRGNDGRARASMQALCFADVIVRSPARLDHWVPNARELAKALDALAAPVRPDPDCAARLDAEIAAALDAAEARFAAGDVAAARTALVAIDDRWGGLAAPRSVELARRMLPALRAQDTAPAE